MDRPPVSGPLLGLDVGAVSLSLVEVDAQGRVVHTFYAPHHGEVEACLEAGLRERGPGPMGPVAATDSSPSYLRVHRRFNDQICLMAGTRCHHPEARSVLVVGGERFGLIRFDPDGEYLSFRHNPGCAAGTGGFLDQQARRLDLAGVQELAALALASREPPPKIASRCAVFAKTDLVHAQQEGYSLGAICDGLCRGVARSIVDTLITGEVLYGPLLVVGGVARNEAVVRHLRDLLEVEVMADREIPLGAAGAALKLLEEREMRGRGGEGVSLSPEALLERLVAQPPGDRRAYEYPPLDPGLQGDPAPEGEEGEGSGLALFRGQVVNHSQSLELETYREPAPPLSDRPLPVYLGVDIGSTSTKAALTTREGKMLAGFYTGTAGKPLVAVQLILEAVDAWARARDVDLEILGAGTTGAGRKFIGRILGADLILDEITAHARAAVELHPGVDTIIEIGGQDSKFTTLRDGRVTLSVMNSVCAAGTGSFIEEQARRLDVPLSEYAARTRGCPSPMASERCTVFMERDLNHYLREGYSTGEVLAAVLHSVRENYLNKVAVEAAVGDTVVFQGATARNRALVAAFQQRLGKPILVSRYCHLTGALGAALTLRDEGIRVSTFRGVGLHRSRIPVRSEICELCANHCKLSVAEVEGETVACGFLCGRDWETRKHVRSNTSGFDLFRARKRALSPPPGRRLPPPPSGEAHAPPAAEPASTPTVGLPAALHLFEDLPFWKSFFRRLGVRVITSQGYPEALKEGRKLARAELCAPMTALHGHVRYLLDRADRIFLPFYLERRSEPEGPKRKLCYYTQFAPTLARSLGGPEDGHRVVTPLVHSSYGSLVSGAELYRALQDLVPGGLSPLEVFTAFEETEREQEKGRRALRDVYRREAARGDGFHVVLLGRPYTVLSRWMNKGIPETFASLGVRVFYQDMLPSSGEALEAVAPILEDVHWHYAARILESAQITALTPGAYPVLVTSFRCSPDSFVTTYFRQILEAHEKPHLVLELDEHDSRLGYETRIEAAVRAFRNHHEEEPFRARIPGGLSAPKGKRHPSLPLGSSHREVDLEGRTLYFPNWDSTSLRLLVAAVRRTGLDARLLEASEGSVRRSLRHNSGQCTPLSIIAQDFMETVEAQGVDPDRAVLWMMASNVACNIHLFPHHIRTILETHGQGFEEARVYAGGISLQDIAATLPLDGYLAYMFGGFLRRMGCRIRPREATPGATDGILEESLLRLEDAFETGESKEAALGEVIAGFREIPMETGGGESWRPKVAIFGDLYARDNRVLNQDLVHFIEAHGGEVITTPYTSYLKMVARPYYWKWFLEGKYLNVVTAGVWMTALTRLEKRYFRYFESVLGEGEPAYDVSPRSILSEYNVRVEHSGESMDNLLKVFYITRHHPDVALFVQVSPAYCCPSLVTQAMTREIQEKTGVPVVSVTYDGTGGGKNDVILPYLEHARRRWTA